MSLTQKIITQKALSLRALLAASICLVSTSGILAQHRPQPQPDAKIFVKISAQEITISQNLEQEQINNWCRQIPPGCVFIACNKMNIKGDLDGQRIKTLFQFTDAAFFVPGGLNGHAKELVFDSVSQSMMMHGTEQQPVVIHNERQGEDLQCSSLRAKVNLKENRVMMEGMGSCSFGINQLSASHPANANSTSSKILSTSENYLALQEPPQALHPPKPDSLPQLQPAPKHVTTEDQQALYYELY